MALAKSYRWVILLIGAPTATLITLIILIILIILISAARRVQQISAVIQNSGADLPQGSARQLDGCGGMRKSVGVTLA